MGLKGTKIEKIKFLKPQYFQVDWVETHPE